MNSRERIRMLTEGALMIAAAQILSYIKLWRMPWGGSVVLAMVPLVLFAVRRGLAAGLMVGLVYGTLQFTLDGGIAIGWESILGDYLLAFVALGLAGLAKGKPGGVFLGTLIGCLARFVVHWVVGATIWAEYMPESFLGMNMSSPWVYSGLYNLIYMGANTLITLVAFALLWKPMHRFLVGEDLAQ